MAVNDKASLNPLQWTGEDILEYILLLCAGETTFEDLMHLMISSSPMILKKYLFYLIAHHGGAGVCMVYLNGMKIRL
jgi:hypothetical protein